MKKEELIKLCGSKDVAVKVIKKLKKEGHTKELLDKFGNVYGETQGTELERTKQTLKLMFPKKRRGITYIIDMEGRLKKLKKKFPELKIITSRKMHDGVKDYDVVIYPCYDFLDIVSAREEIMKLTKPVSDPDNRDIICLFGETSTGKSHALLDMAMHAKSSGNDCICFETAGEAWSEARNKYARDVYGKDEVELIREIKRRLILAGKKIKPASFDGLLDWPHIKDLHKRFMGVLTRETNCNIMITAQAKQIIEFGKIKDDSEAGKEISNVFGDLGYRPAGEKWNIYKFDTILLLERFLKEYKCDKCGNVFKKRVRICAKCENREFTSSYSYFCEAFKNYGKKEFGSKEVINKSVYETYLKYS